MLQWKHSLIALALIAHCIASSLESTSVYTAVVVIKLQIGLGVSTRKSKRLGPAKTAECTYTGVKYAVLGRWVNQSALVKGDVPYAFLWLLDRAQLAYV